MEVVFQTTKKNPKPIHQGQQYVAVMADNSVIVTVADNTREEAPGVRARFLTRSGAKKFIDENPIKAGRVETAAPKVEVKVAPVKTAAELKEESLSKLDPFVQLDEVKSKEDYKAWLKRNKLTVAGTRESDRAYIKLNKAGSDALISYNWASRGGFFCCGGREHGSHGGGINIASSQYITKARLETLSTYLAPLFGKLTQDLIGKGYGVISYIRNPSNMGDASARIGLLFEASKYFDLAGTFNNPNGGNELSIYTVNEEWPKSGGADITVD